MYNKKAFIGKEEMLDIYEEVKYALKSDKFKQFVESTNTRYTDQYAIASDIVVFGYGIVMTSIMERAGYSKEETLKFIGMKDSYESLNYTKDTNKVIPYKGRNKKCKN